MVKWNRKDGRLLTWILVITLLLSATLTAQARPQNTRSFSAGERRPRPLAPNALPAPALLEPADGTHTTGNPNDPLLAQRELYQPLGIPCFTWESVLDSDGYQLQITETPQTDVSVVFDTNKLMQPMYCPTAYDLVTSSHGIQDETEYYWHVRALGIKSEPDSPWSDWRSFTRNWASPPTLTSPAAGATLVQPPVLTWTPVDGAESYELEVSSDANFPDVGTSDWPAFTWQLNPQNNQYTLVTGNSNPKNYLPNDATIYWRVRPVSGGNVTDDYRIGPWSNGGDGQVFDYCWACNRLGTDIGVDYRPKHLTPDRTNQNVNSAYFSWTPVENAAAYQIEINDTSSFEQTPSGHLLSNNKPFMTFNTGLLWEIDKNWDYYNYLSQIYWRVRAITYYGIASEWTSELPNISSVFGPRAALDPRYVPVTPDLLYPHFYYEPIYNHELWEDRTVSVPTFVWDQVPGATSYTIEASRDNLFEPVAWSHTTANLSATPTSTVPFSQTGLYYWHVMTHPHNSPHVTTWSQRWETRIDQSAPILTPTTAPPRLLYPTYREEGDGNTYAQETLEHFPRLDWYPVIGADHYEVQIARDDSFSSLLEPATETELTSYTPTTRYPPDTYYWRVRALGGGGTLMGIGEGWSTT